MWYIFSGIVRGRRLPHGIQYMDQEHWVWGTQFSQVAGRSLLNRRVPLEDHGLGSL